MSFFELVNFSFSVSGKRLFDDVTLQLERNQIFCIESANLDGGTSLLKCCSGIYQPSSGQILLEGISIGQLPHDKRFKRLSYCYELGGLISSFNIYNNIAFPLLFNGVFHKNEVKTKIYKMAELLRIDNLLVLELHQINDVQMRLLNLLRALCIQPKILLLDELQAGMSDNMIEHVIDVLKQQQQQHSFSVLMTTTGGDQTDFADRVLKIEGEKLVES